MTSHGHKYCSYSGWRVLLTLTFALLACGNLFAQVTASSTINGNVKDKNQAVISNASVTIVNKANGLSRTTTTNDTGEFRVDLLPAGRYDIKVSASGFGDVTIENA